MCPGYAPEDRAYTQQSLIIIKSIVRQLTLWIKDHQRMHLQIQLDQI
jgi:hypothetical protein